MQNLLDDGKLDRGILVAEEYDYEIIGDKTNYGGAQIFGVNFYEIGLAGKVCDYFKELIAGPGAVRKTLEKYV